MPIISYNLSIKSLDISPSEHLDQMSVDAPFKEEEYIIDYENSEDGLVSEPEISNLTGDLVEVRRYEYIKDGQLLNLELSGIATMASDYIFTPDPRMSSISYGYGGFSYSAILKHVDGVVHTHIVYSFNEDRAKEDPLSYYEFDGRYIFNEKKPVNCIFPVQYSMSEYLKTYANPEAGIIPELVSPAGTDLMEKVDLSGLLDGYIQTKYFPVFDTALILIEEETTQIRHWMQVVDGGIFYFEDQMLGLISVDTAMLDSYLLGEQIGKAWIFYGNVPIVIHNTENRRLDMSEVVNSFSGELRFGEIAPMKLENHQ